MTKTNTKYYTFTGTTQWDKVYQADEFLGKERWTLNLFLDDE